MAAMDRLPGRAQKCVRCGELIVWARTVASERGKGGKPMPLDVVPSAAGNVAVRVSGHALFARALGRDDTLDRVAEVRAMPHFATCGKQLVPEIEAYLREQADGGEQP